MPVRWIGFVVVAVLEDVLAVDVDTDEVEVVPTSTDEVETDVDVAIVVDTGVEVAITAVDVPDDVAVVEDVVTAVDVDEVAARLGDTTDNGSVVAGVSPNHV